MSAVHAEARPARGDARARRARLAGVAAVVFALGMFASVVALRWRSHYSNVDDYLYALQTRAYLDALGPDPRGLVDAWRAYGSNSPLVPMLALPLAAIDGSPRSLVLVQALPLLVVLLSVRSLLRDLLCGPRAAWLAAAVITTLPPVLGYASMYHFALAATAGTTLAVAAYARSDRLLRRRAALVLGAAVGLLALARVVAPVYVVALCAPIVVDVLAEREDRGIRARNGGLAALVAGVLAAPWWLLAGGTALRYLTSAGYGHAAPAGDGSRLQVALDRLTWTATETGWLLAVVLAALLAWASVCLLRRPPGWRLAAMPAATSLAGLALLGTSGNAGTAFALPYVVLLCCVAVWGIGRLPARIRGGVAAVCVASLVLPALALLDLAGPAEVGGRELWQVGTPGVAQARAALACDCAPPDTDALADRVVAVVGGRPVLLLRDDALLNANSLRYAALRRGAVADLMAPAADGTVTAAQLGRADYVVAGGTLGTYHPAVDQLALVLRLRAARFRVVLRRRLSALNSVAVWAAPGAPASAPADP